MIADSKTLNILDQISPKYLMGGINEVAKDWYSKNDNFEFYKFMYVIKGSAQFTLPDYRLNLMKDEFIIIPANITHSYKKNTSDSLHLYWCHIELNSNITSLLKKQPSSSCMKNCEHIKDILYNVIHTKGDSPVLKLLSRKVAMLQLFHEYFSHLEVLELTLHSHDSFYNNVSTFIDLNYQRAITVDELASYVHLHPNYFHHVFHSHFHMSPIAYLNKVRLETSAKLLSSNSHSTINQIALDCGYNDYRYFTRAFKKRYGVTPTSYRRDYGSNLNL